MGTRVGVRSRWRALCGWGVRFLAGGRHRRRGAADCDPPLTILPAHGPLPAGETRIEVANKVIRVLERAHVSADLWICERDWGRAASGNSGGAGRVAGGGAIRLGKSHVVAHESEPAVRCGNLSRDTEKTRGLLESQMQGATGTGSGFPIWRRGTIWRNRWACGCFC